MACSFRRLGRSKSCRHFRAQSAAICANVGGGQMMAFKASARRHVRLQSAGAGSGEGAARGVSGFAGGKSGRFGRRVFDQEREEKMRGDPGSGEPRVLSGQPVEAQDRFQSFEG